VQLVTNGVLNFVANKKMLEEKRTKLFWSRSAAHCLYLIFEYVGKLSVFYNTIANAKKKSQILNLHRKYSKGK